MFDFAKHVLGPVYVVVFLTGVLLTALFVGPFTETNRPVGIGLLLFGVFASMVLAAASKELVRKIRRN